MRYLDLQGIRQVVRRALQTSAGEEDANKIVATNADGQIDMTLIPDGIKKESKTTAVLVGEVTSGDLLHVYEDGGWKVKRASVTEEANGFAPIFDEAPTAGDAIDVMRTGTLNRPGASFVVNERYFLGDAGLAQVEPDTDDFEENDILQEIGVAISVNQIIFRPRVLAYF